MQISHQTRPVLTTSALGQACIILCTAILVTFWFRSSSSRPPKYFLCSLPELCFITAGQCRLQHPQLALVLKHRWQHGRVAGVGAAEIQFAESFDELPTEFRHGERVEDVENKLYDGGEVVVG